MKYPERKGKEKCERKAYPHRVYPDRNRIPSRVNGAIVCDIPRIFEGASPSNFKFLNARFFYLC